MADNLSKAGATEGTALFHGCRDMARREAHAGAGAMRRLQNRIEQPGRPHRSLEQPVKVDPGKWTKNLDRMPRSERGDRRGKKAVSLYMTKKITY